MTSLTVVTGPMFSGKTEALIALIKRAHDAALAIQVFVPASDTRNGVGVVKSHGGLDLAALGISAWAVTPDDHWEFGQRIRPRTEVVAIDEAQFFPSSLVDDVHALLQRNLTVYIAGLDQDYLGRPFGPMPGLLALADHVRKLTAICARCRQDGATLTYRNNPSTDLVLLGASDAYSPMCRPCRNKIIALGRA